MNSPILKRLKACAEKSVSHSGEIVADELAQAIEEYLDDLRARDQAILDLATFVGSALIGELLDVE